MRIEPSWVCASQAKKRAAAEKAAAEKAAGLAFLTPMRAAERTHREAAAPSFYFVRADKLRGCTLKTLPRLQDLQRDHADWIVRASIAAATERNVPLS